MLEEHDKIDTIARDGDGSLMLVIMDAGLTEDPHERHSHLIEKLRAYVAYATSASFRNEYPNVRAEEVKILVMCRIPPTERMLDTTAISRADNPEFMIPVSYRHFPGTDEEEPEGLPESAEARPARPRSIGGASNAPVHITFGILFLYLAATRYLLYFGAAKNLHSVSPAQAIGATLGYLFVWSLGYWFCATAAKKTLVTWLGGIAVFVSPLFGPFVGYILLIVIYFVRRAQKAG